MKWENKERSWEKFGVRTRDGKSSQKSAISTMREGKRKENITTTNFQEDTAILSGNIRRELTYSQKEAVDEIS